MKAEVRTGQPLSKSAIRTLADEAAMASFGVRADRLAPRLTSGSTGTSAEARRIALVARYAKK